MREREKCRSVIVHHVKDLVVGGGAEAVQHAYVNGFSICFREILWPVEKVEDFEHMVLALSLGGKILTPQGAFTIDTKPNEKAIDVVMENGITFQVRYKKLHRFQKSRSYRHIHIFRIEIRKREEDIDFENLDFSEVNFSEIKDDEFDRDFIREEDIVGERGWQSGQRWVRLHEGKPGEFDAVSVVLYTKEGESVHVVNHVYDDLATRVRLADGEVLYLFGKSEEIKGAEAGDAGVDIDISKVPDNSPMLFLRRALSNAKEVSFQREFDDIKKKVLSV